MPDHAFLPTLIISFCQRNLLVFLVLVVLAASGLAAAPVNAQDRILRVSSMATAGGVQSQVEMPIRLVSLGDERSASFSIRFNPFFLQSPVAALASEMPPGSTLAVNTNNLAQGELGVIVNAPYPFTAGTHKIVTVTFTIPANVPPGISQVAFGSVPTPQFVSNSAGESLPTVYQNGLVIIGTADGIGLSGRVLTPDGRGLANATVIATDTNGDRRLARTSSFGQFNFPYVRLGETYIFTVQSKRYRFTPRII